MSEGGMVWRKGRVKSCSSPDAWYKRKVGEVMKLAQSQDEAMWTTKNGRLVQKCDVEFTAATAINPVSNVSSAISDYVKGTKVTDVESNIDGAVTSNDGTDVYVWFDGQRGSGVYCFDMASAAYSGGKLKIKRKDDENAPLEN